MADAALAHPSSDIIDLISNDGHTDYDSDSTLKDDMDQRQSAPGGNTNSSQMQAVCRIMPLVKHLGSTLKAGKNVELKDGDFLRITELLQEVATDKVFLKGHRFRRNVYLKGLLELKRNELHQLVRQRTESDLSDHSSKNIWFVHLTDVVRVRDLIKTNMLWPAENYKEVEQNYKNFEDQYQKDHLRLVCRWKYCEINAKQGVIQRLSKNECDIVHSVADSVLRRTFRGDTIEFGRCDTWLPGEKDFDDAERVRTHHKDPLDFYSGSPMALIDLTIDDSDRRYTFGDGFCCSGGTSRGAKGAGLRVAWGFDHDMPAIYSYRKNFAHTDCWAVDAHHFVAMFDEDDNDHNDAADNDAVENHAADNNAAHKARQKPTAKVDILHLSPPCQTFSPAHTREGQHDEQNSASFFALEEVLKITKPRIVTVEETFGLTRTVENMPYFRSMIQTFTRLGFSVRWRVLNLKDFGLPQPRKRLFIIASCAGESLPPFPEPTYCDPAQQHLHPNRKPWTTVNQVINQLPAGISLHNPGQMPAIHESPYDGNHPLRTTITCGTGQLWHPSGRRAFTLREIACLQGFPLEHEFGTVGVRKQIGNAVPPIVAKVIFETIIKHLKKVDSDQTR
ncbi:MAG: hypothetical protein OHK93_002080 [Ramalina farinacea]|uniref:DNA (cytosine-5-)-methyltransferase n=1 Tax=Ramalina farinacea TaxID=258253 RepID=A0AA43TYC8_9LECA|nr:hypothetical protein [Ramalina farinacea]